ncbi:MAG: NADH-quinone oxidoreductase subunit A [Elusimicrobiota bacterium]
MMLDYVTLFTFALVAVVFSVVAMGAARLLRPQVDDPVKETTYECGMDAVGTTELQTNIRFYLFALLFVIFDVETIFVFPWAVVVRDVGPVALIEMLVFLAILFLGLVYAWLKGALVWDTRYSAAKTEEEDR